ncbi:MAG TPA: ribosome biogenesis GTPase Der [Actinomycetota bacterium]|nr:ribosome biogenesis GTPase Der [Actinomycetota bacterium]
MPEEGAPVVALLGRQNVGKSTLANRLTGRRAAIAHETPGVTRDRIDLPVTWRGRTFRLLDTGGFVRRARGIDASVAAQAVRAAEAADLVLLVVDAATGIQEEDADLAHRLLRSGTPVLVVANKVDGERQEPLAAEFHALGLGEPAPVSALHGRGSGELLDRVLDLISESAESQPEDEASFALVGRPNVGKSSLFNRLVHEERAVVHDMPGTTRDAVDSVVTVQGRRLRFVDTAGFRRPLRTEGVEYYGLLRAIQAVESADVALLVLDANQGLTGEDKRIEAKVREAGRGLAVALNKWDLVLSGERADLFVRLSEEARVIPGAPVLRMSALTGTGVGRLAPTLLGVHERWSRRVPTAEVNRVLERATGSYPPPRGTPHIRYGTQVAAGPPTFVLFGAERVPPSYGRYLENSLREAFGFDGVPIRLRFRGRRTRGRKGSAAG